MGKSGETFWDTALLRRAVKRWTASARGASTAKLGALRRQRVQARLLRAQLDRLIQVADARLAAPVSGQTDIPTPPNSDWAWRPRIWCVPLPVRGMASVENRTRVGEEITLFHDCPRSEIALRQISNPHDHSMAAWAIRLDVFEFGGSFLSCVLDLPQEAVTGLNRNHILRVSNVLDVDRPVQVFVRLNLRHGPNTEQIVREFPFDAKEASVEFDLAYANVKEARLEKAWVDLIFDNPRMNRITVQDLTFSRRPRAQL
ncbi:DUF6478 family protein [Roseobacter weihaiensis]|uniref:DUF6478 family protein n=1 Tax=Roseobacter weihaiensis TaxID=2763262 RepID=UPI001D09B01C|nr:DUF6478 family protein [Roseobacter sp. H9]